MLRRLRGAGTQLHARPARGARRARSGWSRGRGLRAGRCQGNRHARSRARPRAAPQFPCLDRLLAGATERRDVHPRARRRRIGHGVQRDQPRAARRTARRVRHDDARAVRLLGDRIRLQGAPAGAGERRAAQDRFAQQRTVARLRHRRRQQLRHRPGSQHAGSRQRSAGVRAAASRCSRASYGIAGRTASLRPAKAMSCCVVPSAAA